MVFILLFTILGFLSGLAYCIKKRKKSPGKILAAAFFGLLSAGLWKGLQEYFKRHNRRRYY